MPMPSRKLVSISMISMRNRLFPATEVITLMNLKPSPVWLMTPTTMPEQAQQATIISEPRAVAASVSKNPRTVKRVSLLRNEITKMHRDAALAHTVMLRPLSIMTRSSARGLR